jgi:phosphate transport system substrate-binding protein
MVNLSQKWAETYMIKNPNESIQVTGGGSGTGIAALLNGTMDIANASRELKQKEYDKAKELGITPREFKVALDGIAVIVHPENPIEELTIDQLRDLFIGKVENWNELGGNDSPITLYGRENSSGTYEFFKDKVLGKDERGHTRDFANSTQVLQGTAALGEAVARDTKGVGYGGVGYFAARTDVKILKVKENDEAPAIAPASDGKVNYEAIWSGEYSISRYLYCYTNGTPEKKIQDFMDFCLSKEGQDLVKQMEYIPLPK